ncbi:60s ribosomal l35 [Tubulinosema ratisbonensis]|uniref:60s ribosomal l35 n=1 Tax=Tubulinosema ratisbonensis TaxID=291195 RepID=A0A437APQ2_9MICR|nr:60s ribosomal l35 [Tubulinosema ratisbonensis]
MKINVEEIRSKSLEELEVIINELKSEQLRLRQQKNSHSIKPHELKEARRNIARAMTVRTEKLYEQAWNKHKNDKVLPKELRPKLTRAKRLALTPKQQRKREKHMGGYRTTKKIYYSLSE